MRAPFFACSLAFAACSSSTSSNPFAAPMPQMSASSATARPATSGPPSAIASTSASTSVAPISSVTALAQLTERLTTMRKVCGEGHPEALPATLAITLEVTPDGVVGKIDINQTKGGQVVASCARHQLQAWRFPPSKAGMKYPFSVSY